MKNKIQMLEIRVAALELTLQGQSNLRRIEEWEIGNNNS
jgi:hypothetical protein